MLSDSPDTHEPSDARVDGSPPTPPLSPREYKALLRAAEHLVTEVPRLLHRHRHRISTGTMWDVADAVRLLKAELEGQRREARLKRLAAQVDLLVDRHLGFARRSVGWEFAEALLIAFVIALFIRATLFEAFKIPSGSMIPTLRVGDRIFVSKFVYGIDVPFTDIRLFDWRKPTRGEVIVFEYPGPGPDHGIDFIKRVVAEPGDRVRMTNNRIHINGEPMGTVDVLEAQGQCAIPAGETCTWSGRRQDPRLAVARGRSGDGCPCVIQQETAGGFTWTTQHVLPGVSCHCQDGRLTQEARNGSRWPTEARIHQIGDGWTARPHDWVRRDDEGNLEMEVPPGHVLVMGDNRDFSRDGREWGLVPHENVKGKALTVWYAIHDRSHRMFRPIHHTAERVSDVLTEAVASAQHDLAGAERPDPAVSDVRSPSPRGGDR